MRVSTEEQARYGVSLAAQLARIRAYALMSGLEISRVISEDGVSGAKRLESRPGGAELVRALGRTAEHVIALKLDRLFRDAEDALAISRQWDRSGITLHVIDMGGSALNTSSAMGRMFLTMTAAFAELERNLIAERTSSALQHKKKGLKVYSPVPVGFDRVDDELVPNHAETELVAEIKRMTGRMSFRAIAAALNGRGVPTKRGGKQWYASTVQQIAANDIHA